MATVNKDFKIKSGLIVEGTSATVNGYDVLTKNSTDETYIVNLIGGTATSANTPDTVVKRDGFGIFAATQIDLDSKLTTPDVRIGDAGKLYDNSGTLELTGYNNNDVTISAPENVNITTNNADINLNPDGSVKIWGDVVATQNYVDGLASNYDPAGSASSAQTAAESYADSVASNAENNAKSYADSLASNYDAAGSATTAENNAKSYADSLASNYDAAGAATTALNDAKSYTDQEVAALVDGAPALLDTLNELAAAINDNPNYATDVANLVSGKQDTLTAGTGITIDGLTDTISVTANTYDAYGAASSAQTAAESYADGVAGTAEQNAKNYADGLASNYDAAGSATTAENNAKSYADGLAVNYDPAGSASSAETAANTYTDNAITNLNLSTTYDAYGAAATAESNANGYTDTAISNGNSSATPTYQGVNFSWATQQTGAYSYVPTASIATVFQWTGYPTAKFIVRVRAGVHSQVSEILLTTDNNGNVAITEYGIVGTNGNLGNVSANYDAGTWSLTVETTENNSEVIVSATLMAYGD